MNDTNEDIKFQEQQAGKIYHALVKQLNQDSGHCGNIADILDVPNTHLIYVPKFCDHSRNNI